MRDPDSIPQALYLLAGYTVRRAQREPGEWSGNAGTGLKGEVRWSHTRSQLQRFAKEFDMEYMLPQMLEDFDEGRFPEGYYQIHPFRDRLVGGTSPEDARNLLAEAWHIEFQALPPSAASSKRKTILERASVVEAMYGSLD